MVLWKPQVEGKILQVLWQILHCAEGCKEVNQGCSWSEEGRDWTESYDTLWAQYRNSSEDGFGLCPVFPSKETILQWLWGGFCAPEREQIPTLGRK